MRTAKLHVERSTITSAVTFGFSVKTTGFRCVVKNIRPGGAAEIAGVKLGDVITSINGTELTPGMGLPTIVKMIKESGQDLTLELLEHDEAAEALQAAEGPGRRPTLVSAGQAQMVRPKPPPAASLSPTTRSAPMTLPDLPPPPTNMLGLPAVAEADEELGSTEHLPPPPEEEEEEEGKAAGARAGGERGPAAPASPTPDQPPVCSQCGQAVDLHLPACQALDKTWHPACFRCSVCSRMLLASDSSAEAPWFFESKGKLFCEDHYEQHVAPSCARCSKPILGPFIESDVGAFHPECFTCKSCDCHLEGIPFVPDKGQVYCRDCWHEQFGPKCFRCNKPIAATDDSSAKCVTVRDQVYHADCFSCHECGKAFAKGDKQGAYPVGGELYCYEHAKRRSMSTQGATRRTSSSAGLAASAARAAALQRETFKKS